MTEICRKISILGTIIAFKCFIVAIPLLHLNLNIAISVQYKKNMDRERNAITIIYLLQKKSRELPKVTLIQMDDALQPQSSLAEYSRFVWGVERIYVVNRWKYYPDYFPDPLSLSAKLVKARARDRIFQKHTSPEHVRHVAICDECRREPMSVRFSCRKPVVLKRQYLNS